MIEVVLNFKNYTTSPIEKEAVENTLKQALSKLKKNGIFEISVTVCGNKRIQKLNKVYRNIDKPTDVLSFGQDNFKLKSQPRFLGDIVLSAPYITRQANEYKLSFEEEFDNLLVHGLKHLCGIHHKE